MTPASKTTKPSLNESRVNILTSRGDKVGSLDSSSEDGEHGFAVAKAAWTPDGDYFVYSLENSAGHAPCHTPTQSVSFRHFTWLYVASVPVGFLPRQSRYHDTGLPA